MKSRIVSINCSAALDNPASSAITQETLNWHPAQPGLIADLREGAYFKV